jgi:hypothetical protein
VTVLVDLTGISGIRVVEVAIVIDSDLPGDVDGSTGTDHSIAELPGRSVQNP